MIVDFVKKLLVVVDELGKECYCVVVNKVVLFVGMVIDYIDIVWERIKK